VFCVRNDDTSEYTDDLNQKGREMNYLRIIPQRKENTKTLKNIIIRG
jgi:hypothetical protein